MKKKNVMTKIMVGIMTAAAVFLGAAAGSISGGEKAVVSEAAGRPVAINSCTIQGGDIVVNVSASSVPGSDDGKYYLYSDEVYQDGPIGKVVATADIGASATLVCPLNFYQQDSNLSKKFLVAVKRGGSMEQVSDEHYITNPEAIATKTVARNDHGMKGILPNDANAETFKDLGINVPRVTELSAALIREKIYDGEVTLTVDEAEEMVRRILK